VGVPHRCPHLFVELAQASKKSPSHVANPLGRCLTPSLRPLRSLADSTGWRGCMLSVLFGRVMPSGEVITRLLVPPKATERFVAAVMTIRCTLYSLQSTLVPFAPQ
jgi:hypothetical protein